MKIRKYKNKVDKSTLFYGLIYSLIHFPYEVKDVLLDSNLSL